METTRGFQMNKPILKSMSREDVLKQLEVHFMKHFRVSKPCGEWICYPESQSQKIYHKLHLILSWLTIKVLRMEDRHALAYTITVMKTYRPFTFAMMFRGCLPCLY